MTTGYDLDIVLVTTEARFLSWFRMDIPVSQDFHITSQEGNYSIDFEIIEPSYKTEYIGKELYEDIFYDIKFNGSNDREVIFLGFMEIRPLSDVRIQVIGVSEDYRFNDPLRLIGERIAKYFPAIQQSITGTRPEKPPPPPKGSTREEFFKYYHFCKERGFKYTLNNLAKDSEFSPSTIRRTHCGCSICHPTQNTD